MYTEENKIFWLNRLGICPTKHPFHIVNPSPLPFFAALAGGLTTSSFVGYMHYHVCPAIRLSFFFSVLFLTLVSSKWFYDIIQEKPHHTTEVVRGLAMGMALFIVSEVMFFFSFFFAFFYSALSPSVGIGCVWPPKGIIPLDPYSLPLLNTVILVSSGVTLTWAHCGIRADDRKELVDGLFFTILLGVVFTCFQVFEYSTATFYMDDGIYGSIFYMSTGFHGFHVILGTLFLLVCLVRAHFFGHFDWRDHFGVEAAAWYWHFVDVVWLFLYM